MKKTMMLAAIPAMFALAACGETANEDTAETETALIDDDNDAPEPVGFRPYRISTAGFGRRSQRRSIN